MLKQVIFLDNNVSDSNSSTKEKVKIIQFAKRSRLERDILNLQSEVSLLLFKRDKLLLVECANLEMEYLLELGELELKLARLDYKIRLLEKRLNERVLNGGISDSISPKLEPDLDPNLIRSEKRLRKLVFQIGLATERRLKGTFLDRDSESRLGQLYYRILSLHHPEINMQGDYKDLRVFYAARSAYEDGDLETLEKLAAPIGESPPKLSTASTALDLLAERDRLSQKRQNILDEIGQIEISYPYTLKSIVSSPEKMALKREELTERISRLNELYTGRAKKLTAVQSGSV